MSITETNPYQNTLELGSPAEPDSDDLSLYEPQVSSEARDALHGYLSYIVTEAGCEQIVGDHLPALTDMMSDGIETEDDPHYHLKIGILDAFDRLKTGKEVPEAHLILAGLFRIINAHKGAAFNPVRDINQDIARARAFVNSIHLHDGSASPDVFYLRLSRIVSPGLERSTS